MKKITLNADVGESFGAWTMGLDAEVIPHVDLVNIACGFHASDPDTMRTTVQLAQQHGVGIGAHPAYPDLVGFGRRSMACSPAEIENMLLYQLGALAAICRAENTQLSHVKPHGALYNDIAQDSHKLEAVMRAVALFDVRLPLMILARSDNSAAESIAQHYGITLWFEAFADRAYQDNGLLTPRTHALAVYHQPEQILQQVTRLAQGCALTSVTGGEVLIQANTICVHGDNPQSIALIKHIKQRILQQ